MIYPFFSDSPSENSRGGNDSRWVDGRKLNDKHTNTDGVGVEIFSNKHQRGSILQALATTSEGVE